MPRVRLAGNDDERRDVEPVAMNVHVDITEETARKQTTALLAERGMGHITPSRIMFLSNWRVLSDPPQDYPLAVCDPDTMTDKDGVPGYLIATPELPTKPYPPVPEPDSEEDGLVDFRRLGTKHRLVGVGYSFHYNPELRWLYYSNMTKDELLSFKLTDTDHSSAWRVPHTAFFNDREGTIPRHSLEVRTYCVWK